MPPTTTPDALTTAARTGAGGTDAGGIGVVVIGRNEGERLMRCLASLRGRCAALVYVDSGSSDHSCEKAEALGVTVLRLDPARPFTAARARNEGYALLQRLHGPLEFVQFVDGDCEVSEGWLAAARAHLQARPRCGLVGGRLRERFPERSIYNRLCDMEWDRPLGEVPHVGGIFLARSAAFDAVKGFRTDLIASEEPEMCVRLRGAGWTVEQIAPDMAFHDANMLHFRQWWTRTLRGGHAAAQGRHLHGDSPERLGVDASRRAWLWGLGIPLAALVATLAWWPFGAAAWLVYPLQILRLTARGPRSLSDNLLSAVFLVIGKFPELLGQIRFRREQALGQRPQLIEYKQ